jgi:L-alanine-DL-glutamate epimerase-like enolase superfamily enzyme
MVSSADSVGARPLIRLRLAADDGFAGDGEAAPLTGYDRITAADVELAVRDCRPALRGDGRDRAATLARCAERTTLPQALAAVDLALWDLTGRRAGEPVWRLLGASVAPRVEVNATIGAIDRAGAAHEAAAARDAGFRALKVKVGVGDDAGRLAAVRAAAGREMAIRLDANGAWSVDEAIAALAALEPVGIECCEEPVHGLEEIERVAAATAVPVAIDETAADPGALDERVCAAVCLKISRCGGISGLLRDAARARAAGYEVYLASTLDGPLGIAAALHAAAVVRPERPCGLATLALFAGRADPLPPRRGRIAPPAGPGLGDALAGWYREGI